MNSSEGLLSLPFPIILASQSPRRRQLLQQIGLHFSVQPAHIDELALPVDMQPDLYAGTLAMQKAQAIADQQDKPACIIGCDTIVVLDTIILNKPANAAQARIMLGMLSGRTHTVYTGIALVFPGTDIAPIQDVQSTQVSFRTLEDDEIEAYIATDSPMDKAGAYGIQDDFGAVFVESIQGCYYTIVGLPLEMLYRHLRSVSRIFNPDL
jgi:septum formation protein